MSRRQWEKRNVPKLPKRYREPKPVDPEKAKRDEIARQVRETIDADERLCLGNSRKWALTQ